MAPVLPTNEVHCRWREAMLKGDFEEAWQQTDRLELPRRRGDVPFNDQVHLRWNGTTLLGEDVLVRCLHGLGDTLQFIRYLSLVRHQAASVVTMAQPALLSLLQTNPDFGSIINGWTDITPIHSSEIEIMELPYVFRSSASTIPIPPYFDAREIQKSSKFEWPFLTSLSPRVGIVWQSSNWNPSRSLSLPLLMKAGLGRIRNISLFSFQQDSDFPDDALENIGIHPLRMHTSIALDAAKALLEMDLVITVDTFIAHLAGALDRPVWLLLQASPDWRWQENSSHSPWYPSMRIFRQPSPDVWETLAKEVVHQLQDWSCRV